MNFPTEYGPLSIRMIWGFHGAEYSDCGLLVCGSVNINISEEHAASIFRVQEPCTKLI
jgi:hypothetical protein